MRVGAGATGLGLRPPHYRAFAESAPAVDYVEIIADNFIHGAAPALHWLDRVRERLPVVVHSLGLDVLGADPIDEEYLRSVEALCKRVDAPFVSDHLCWSRSGGARFHDLLPTPYTEEIAGYAAARARWIQARFDRPFGLENLSSYARFSTSTMSEGAFYAQVVSSAEVWFMLDINNVFVSAQNHGFDASAYLSLIPPSRVLQVHLAGHEELPSGALLDTHDHPVREEVWALYRSYIRGLPAPPPTLIERDDRIPALTELTTELGRARRP